MGYQSRFTTSLPAASPFINTGLCMCGGANPFTSHLWIFIPLPWMNRYICIIATIHFCSSLSVQFASACPWVQGLGGAWAGKDHVVTSQPAPHSITSTSDVGPLPWGTPMRTEQGWRNATHGPLLSVTAPCWGCSSNSWPLVSLGSGPLKHLLGCPLRLPTPSGAAGGAAVPEPWGVTGHPGNYASLGAASCAPEREQNPGSPGGQQGSTSSFCGLRARKASDSPVQTIPLDKNANNFMHRRSS